MAAAAEAISLPAADLSTRVAQAGGVLVEDPEDLPNGPDQAAMSTYLSMPLRGHGGAVVGVLALSSATKNAFGETALSTLKLIEGPAAIVIDNARLSAT
jgi:GAF domain-containing protein